MAPTVRLHRAAWSHLLSQCLTGFLGTGEYWVTEPVFVRDRDLYAGRHNIYEIASWQPFAPGAPTITPLPDE